MPVLQVDPVRARDVLSKRAPEPGEIRILMLFKTPIDSDRLLGVEFEEALGDGSIEPAFAGKIIDRLQQEAVLVAPATVDGADVDRADFFGQLASIGRLTQHLSGDLISMGEWAERRVKVDGQSARELLDGVLDQLEALCVGLAGAREAFVEHQLAGPHANKFTCANLHLGSGIYCPEDWVNVDMIGGDMRMNLGWALPFEDRRFRFVFSAHAFEHLDYHTAGPRLLREVCRVLEPGGVFRVVVPDIGAYTQAYAAQNETFFGDFDRVRPEFGTLAGYGTPMAKLMSMSGSAQKSGHWFDHKMGYDFETLGRLLRKAGFSEVKQSQFETSDFAVLREMDRLSHAAGLELGGIANSLFVDAVK
jgi:predicted SAM-dependent methyltransferase